MASAVVINLILGTLVFAAVLGLAAWGIRGSRVEGRARAIRIARGRAHGRPVYAARSRGGRFGEYARDTA